MKVLSVKATKAIGRHVDTGTIVWVGSENSLYLLVRTAPYLVMLTSLVDGNRWDEPFAPDSASNPTEKELDRYINSHQNLEWGYVDSVTLTKEP